ncbi:MAG: hypothetical protein IJG58_07270, partial [Oscillospiraceae bacterium]|nr:hypothetical protein [Oscillospiraceae bacterium]
GNRIEYDAICHETDLLFKINDLSRQAAGHLTAAQASDARLAMFRRFLLKTPARSVSSALLTQFTTKSSRWQQKKGPDRLKTAEPVRAAGS